MPVRVRSRLRRSSLVLSAIESVTARMLRAAGCPHAEVSIEFIGDRRMRKLNRVYRRLDRTTDVLAFGMQEAKGPRTTLLGDVVIALPIAIRQAHQLGHSVDAELITLLIHGIVHLLGYDHERSAAEARRMSRKEREIFKRIAPVPRLHRPARTSRRHAAAH